MLNLKKGLALVLAAATAFTFAPVASLEASAKTIIDWDENTTAILLVDLRHLRSRILSNSMVLTMNTAMP